LKSFRKYVDDPSFSPRLRYYSRRFIFLFFFVFLTGIAGARGIDSIPPGRVAEGIQAELTGDTVPAVADPDSAKDEKPDYVEGIDKDSARYYSRNTADTVFLKNGDRFTGRILSFEQGRLKMDAHGPGVIGIKWHKIASIGGGNRIYKVEDRNGVIYFGTLQHSPDTGEIDVLGMIRYGIMLEDVVRIFPLEEDWFRGFKGNVGAGMSYDKASDVLRLNAEYNLYYVISKWRLINNLSYIETETGEEEPSLRISTILQALYGLPKRWVLSEWNSFNRNDELGITSRISFGAAGGNNIIQTEQARLLVLTGFVVNAERDVESTDVLTNLEWPVSLQHTVYSFASPNLSASSNITSYVGITEKGRYRLDGNIDLTWEFIPDLSLQFSVYYNYDNKLVEGKKSKEDYGTALTLLVDLK